MRARRSRRARSSCATAAGAYIEDVDGKRYVDWVMSWGPLIFGHTDPETVAAVVEAAGRRHDVRRADRDRGGAGDGDRGRRAVDRAGAARLLGHRGGDERRSARPRGHPPRPGAEVRRLLPRPRRRAARRSGLGCGHARHPVHTRVCLPPQRPTRSSAPTTTSTLRRRPSCATARVWPACSWSPWPGTWASFRPSPGFLEALRSLCDASGALLVFDEVITGFRVARGGAQELLRRAARPDRPRQDRRRRPAARRLRRPRRADGAAGARPATSTRPGRSRGIRSRRQPASPCCDGSGARTSTTSSSGARCGWRQGLAPFGRVQRVGSMLTLFTTVRPCAEFRGRAGVRRGSLRRALPQPAGRRRLHRAVAVRGDVRLARPRRRGDRPDDRGRRAVLRAMTASLWDDVARRRASREPALGRRTAGRGGARAGARLLAARRRAPRARRGDDLRGLSPPLRPASAVRCRRRRRTRCCSATICTRTASCASPSCTTSARWPTWRR